MKRLIKTVGVVCATLLFAVNFTACAPLASAATEDFAWQGEVATGQTVEIKGINGSIEALPASGNQVEVSATKKGRRDNPSEVRIEVVEHAGGVTLCAVYPGRNNECRPGKAGNLSAKNNDVQVHFEVRVPAGVLLAARTVNGSVKARDLDGAVKADTTNGSIHVSTHSWAVADTVNGSIEVEMGATSFPDDLSLETVNGSITVRLPRGVNAEVKASSVNGKVRTDFPLDVPRTWHGGKAKGTLGDGGSALKVSTINGSIALRRAG